MCLVLFSWMTNQSFFSEFNDSNLKSRLYEEQMRQIEEESLPTMLAGHIDVDNNDGAFVEGGDFWRPVQR